MIAMPPGVLVPSGQQEEEEAVNVVGELVETSIIS